jgi:ABC-2 type transport system ATP-binding protein
MAETIIETRNLTRRYGRLTAVKELDLQVEAGAVFGFIGPNGAGKTTTMRVLSTLLAPTAGKAWVAGYSVTEDPRGVRRAIGYMPDFFGVYDDMLVWEYMDFFGRCYDLPAGQRTKLTDDLLELVDLSHRRDDPVESLSRGMKQRLCLARTLVHDPQVLILDEPASGLDPRARVEIRELLRELQAMGKTIFVSSHILSELAEICSTIGIIEAGQLVASGNVGDMRRRLRAHRLLRITVLANMEEARRRLAEDAQVSEVRDAPPANGEAVDGPPALHVTFTGDDAAVSSLLADLVSAGLPVVGFVEEPGDLEDVFLQVTKGIVS